MTILPSAHSAVLGKGGRDGSIGRETWFAATRGHFKQEQCLIAALALKLFMEKSQRLHVRQEYDRNNRQNYAAGS